MNISYNRIMFNKRKEMISCHPERADQQQTPEEQTGRGLDLLIVIWTNLNFAFLKQECQKRTLSEKALIWSIKN